MGNVSIGRRTLLLQAGASASCAQADAAEDLSRPAAQLRAYMQMRGALDDRLVVSCIECQYWGVVDARMTPFYDLVAATFARYRPAPGGGYDAVSFEIEYFLDRMTGEVLTSWVNPYTGKTVAARHTDSQPMKLRIGADCQIRIPPASLRPGTVMSHETLPLRVIGDDVWSMETTTARVPVPGSKPLDFNEKIINHARLSDLAVKGAMRVRTDVEYVGISSFRPWQDMGTRPGHMLGLGHGSSGIDPRALPASWIAATRARHPEALVNPGAYLDPLWKTL